MKQKTFEHDCFYHVFSRGNNLEPIFKEEQNYTLFLDLIKKYLLNIADIYAYCLMSNHFHLLIKIKRKEDITDKKMSEKPHLGFSHLLNSYTQKINKTYNRKGSLFQEGLKRSKITNQEYFTQLVAYIHLNPIKHKFSNSLNYSYSSYNAIASKSPTLLKRKELLYYFNDLDNFKAWHDEQKIKLKILSHIEDLTI